MNENIQTNSTETLPIAEPVKAVSANNNSISTRAIIGLILLSLISGMAGGVYGALNLSNREGVQKFFSKTGQAASINQNVVVTEESSITKVVDQTSAAVVSIVISKELSRVPSFSFDPFGFNSQNGNQPQPTGTGKLQEIGAGSGFFISADGLILTNKHVVEDQKASYSVVTNDGKSYEAKVLSRDPVNDLAIVKVDITNVNYLSFADSTKIQLGQHVVAIGNSLGQYQNTVTSGIVSGIGRSIVAGSQAGSEQLDGVIQTDAAINPGNSGGPLLNLEGQVIGINTAIDEQGQLVGFAIPANDAKIALESYQKSGRIMRPYLGVRYVMLTDAIAESQKLSQKSGALIISGSTNNQSNGTAPSPAVLAGSPAERAGIKENDIIISIQGQDLNEHNSLSRSLKMFRAGETISVVLLRGGEKKTIPVILGEAQ